MAVEVGAAFISVKPDLRGFHREIRDDLRKMAPQMLRIGRQWGSELAKGIKQKLTPIKIRLDAAQAASRLVALNRAVEKLDGRQVNIRVEVDALSVIPDLIEIQRQTERLDKRTIKITLDVDVQGAIQQLVVVEQLLDRIERRRTVSVDTDRSVSSLLRLGDSAGVASGGLRLLGRSVAAARLPALAAGISLAAAGLIPLAANLAPVIGLTAALPIVASSAVAGLAALMLALNGVGEAFGAALGDDNKKFQEALEGLAPAARAAALELRAMRPALEEIQEAAQQAFFTPLRGQITALVKALAGPLRQGVRNVAAEFGLAAQAVTRFLATERTVASMNQGFIGLRRSVALMRPALVPVLAGFRDLSIAGIPALLRMSAAVGDVGKRFGEWMSQLAASGRVTEIIGGALDVLKQFFVVLGDLGGILSSVFAAAREAGTGMLGVLGPILDQLNAFLKTAAAQQAMTAFFQALSVIGNSLAQVFVQLAKAVGPLLAQLAQGLAPIMSALVPIFGQAFAALSPVISALIAGLQPAIAALVPVIGVLVGAIGQILTALAPILPVLGQLIAQLLSGLLPVLQPIIQLMAQVIAQVGTALVQALTQSLPSLQQIVLAVASLLPALAPLIPLWGEWLVTLMPLLPIVVQLAAVLVSLLAPVLRFLISVLVRVWTTVGGLILPIFQRMISVISWVAGLVQPILHGIGVAFQAIGRAAVWLWQVAIVPAFNAITAAFRVLSAAGLWLWRVVIVPAFNGITAAIQRSWTFVRPVLNTLAGILRGVLRVAFTILLNAAKAAWIGIQIAVKVAWAFIRPIFNAIRTVITSIIGPAFRWLWRSVIVPAWNGIRTTINNAWSFVRTRIFNPLRDVMLRRLGPAFSELRRRAGQAWDGLRSTISRVWNNGIRPAFDRLREGVGRVRSAFSTAVSGIKRIWDRLKNIARVPVNFVIRLYNNGIVSLVNKIASVAGIKTRLTKIPTFARGGVMPGYRPGVDSLIAAVSPGESIFRPEFTKAVGKGFVVKANDVARRSGVEGVRRWLAGPDAIGGEGLAFARGGVVPRFAGNFAFGGIIGRFVKGVRDFTIGNVGRAAKGLLDRILGGTVPGSGIFRDVVAAIPAWIKDNILKWVSTKIDAGVGGPRVQRALRFARAQAGKPYVWGGVGPGGYDCSGLMSAIVNVIRGRNPYRRLFTTFSFTGAANGPVGFRRNLRSGFVVGVTNAGVGHMSGTLGGVNVESRGSAGVVVGPRARGASNSLYSMRYGLKFDQGGYLPPGLSMVLNGTRKPEPVFTNAQLSSILSGASGGSVVEYHAHFDGMTKAAYEQQVRAGIQAEAVLAAQRDRTGRRR